MHKEEIQNLALKALIDNNGGTIVMDPGSGKSKVALDYMKIKFSEVLNIPKALITSPRTNLKDNWKAELIKWGLISTGDNRYVLSENVARAMYIDIENIQTTYKYDDDKIKEYDLIIMDEIHVMATSEYGKLAKTARMLNIPVVGLTGTPDDRKREKYAFYLLYAPIVYRYTTAEADGIINKKKYIVYEHELSDAFKVTVKTKNSTWEVGEKKQYNFIQSKLTEGEDLIKDCLGIPRDTEEFVDYFAHAKAWYWDKNNGGDMNKLNAGGVYMRAVSARTDILWNLNSTANIAQLMTEHILGEFMNEKVLIFSERTEQARKISPYSVHSKNKPEVNAKLIKMFNEGAIRQMSSCYSLTLGLNLKQAKYAIMESYNGSNVQFKQRSGRVNRLAVDDIAIVTFIVVKNTQAETWFNKAFGKQDNIIRVSNIVDYFDVVRELSYT
jgi:superfamily II DNA or RNA helicase